MAKLRSLRRDPKKVEDGVWAAFEAGIEFRVARWGNPRFVAVYAEKMRPHQAAAQAGVLSEDVEGRIVAETVAETVLRDWKNVTDDAGAEIPYSVERGVETLLDPDYADVYDFVLRTAKNASLFRASELGRAAGN